MLHHEPTGSVLVTCVSHWHKRESVRLLLYEVVSVDAEELGYIRDDLLCLSLRYASLEAIELGLVPHLDPFRNLVALVVKVAETSCEAQGVSGE